MVIFTISKRTKRCRRFPDSNRRMLRSDYMIREKERKEKEERKYAIVGFFIFGMPIILFVFFAFTQGAFSFVPSNDEIYNWEMLEEKPSDNMYYSDDSHNVNGYYNSNGTYVPSHSRSNPDSSPYNNLNP